MISTLSIVVKEYKQFEISLGAPLGAQNGLKS